MRETFDCFFVYKTGGRSSMVSAREMSKRKENDMAENKSSISKTDSYIQIGEH
jgi:hypothetical protein